jgi:hypothetical protein
MQQSKSPRKATPSPVNGQAARNDERCCQVDTVLIALVLTAVDRCLLHGEIDCVDDGRECFCHDVGLWLLLWYVRVDKILAAAVGDRGAIGG